MNRKYLAAFFPLGLIVYYLAQQRMAFRVSHCGCCKQNAFISKEVKVIYDWRCASPPNCQVRLCELDSSGALLAAKHLKLGVPYNEMICEVQLAQEPKKSADAFQIGR